MLQIGFFFKYCMLEKDLNVLLTFSTTPTALYFKHTCLFFLFWKNQQNIDFMEYRLLNLKLKHMFESFFCNSV